MLNQYLQRTQLLLTDMKQEMLNPAFLTMFINTARGQLAGETGCVRFIGSLSTVAATQSYAFSAITTAAGIQNVFNVRRINYTSGSGQKFISPLPWEWFDFYYINDISPTSAAPQVWAQFAQGVLGSFYLFPIPNAIYALKLDASCNPSDLSLDSDAEVIPYPWTDAIPYFAAYLSYMYVQNVEKASQMLGLYREFVDRAGKISTPTVVPYQYEQTKTPVSPFVQMVSSKGSG